MPTIAETIENAVQYHQGGQLRQAEQLYRLVLQNDPNNPVALHSLGVIAHQREKHDKAVELIGKAIANNPQIPQFHNTLGLVFEALEKFEEAVAAYQRAVSIKPDYAEAYHNMAVALQSQGQYAAAVEQCKQAISFRPDYAEAYNTMAFSLEKQEQHAKAIENYRQAIRLKPDFAEAYNHLGVILNDQGRSFGAIENYKQALQLDSDYAEVYNNLGIALKEREQFTEAIVNFEQAIRLESTFAEAYYNLANSLQDEGRCPEAIENYKRAIKLKPDYAKAHWNLAHAFLLIGRLAEGWEEYQWRRNPDLKIISYPHHYEQPYWDGSPFVGKRLFVHYEQGLGDNIQFVRYLPMAKARGGTVIFEARKPLYGLLQGFPGIDELIEAAPDGSTPAVTFDFHASPLDMPRIFGTTLETIPADVPYLYTDPTKVKYWGDRLAGDNFKVGIVWSGDPRYGNDNARSCPLEHFASLAKLESVQLYGLQKGPAAARAEELAGIVPVENLGEQFEDFTDSAAVVKNLDIVISVDTAVLHLAGAMGKPTWALLPFAPDWRWMLNRQDSPWYPTMRLFRQKKWGQWGTVFQSVAAELKILVGKQKIECQKTIKDTYSHAGIS